MPRERKPPVEAYDLFETKLPDTAKGWFHEGLLCPLFGMRLLRRMPNLLPWFLIPVAIQTVISLALLAAFYFFVYPWIDRALQWLVSWAPADSEQLIRILTILGWVVVAVALFNLFVVIWAVTGDRLAGYFGGKLTQRAIDQLGFARSEYRTSVVNELQDGLVLGAMLAGAGPIAGMLTAIPLIGPFLGAPLGLVLIAFAKGADELRDPLAQFGMNRTATIRFCWRHRAASIGVGVMKMFSEPIPAIGGVMVAAENLGRIALARRLLTASEGGCQVIEPASIKPTVTDA